MSFQQIVATEPEAFNKALNEVSDGTIVAIVDPNTDISYRFFEQTCELGQIATYDEPDLVALTFANDEKLAFITTDIMIETEGIRYTKYLNSNQIYSVPFFLKKQGTIKVQEGDIKSQVMSQMLTRGYSYEHIAEPFFCNVVG